MERTGVKTPAEDPVGAAARATRLIFLVSGLAMASWAPMVPYAKARLGLDDATLGLVLLAFGGGSMLSMPVVGWLTHTLGSRKVIIASGLLLCPALPLLALVSGTAALAASLLYFGIMLGAIDVAMNAHAVEVERRSAHPVMSGFHGLFSLGGLAGSAGMSALLAAGLPLLLCTLAVSALLAVLVWTQRASLLNYVDARPQHGGRSFGIPGGLVLLLGLMCFASFLAEGAMLDWSALLLRDFRGYSPSAAGLGYAGFSIAMAAGRLAGDRVIARIGPVLTVRIGASLAALGLLLAACLPWPGTAMLGCVLIGIGASNVVPVMFSAAGRLPNASPGISIATATTLGYAGMLSGPALIGLLAHASSLPMALAAVAALLVLVAFGARIVRRNA